MTLVQRKLRPIGVMVKNEGDLDQFINRELIPLVRELRDVVNANASSGKATLVAGEAAVTLSKASSKTVLLARNTAGGTPGELSAPDADRTATGFVIRSTSATDTSTVDWVAI